MNIENLLKKLGFEVFGNSVKDGTSPYHSAFGILEFWEITNFVYEGDVRKEGNFLVEVDPVTGRCINTISITGVVLNS